MNHKFFMTRVHTIILAFCFFYIHIGAVARVIDNKYMQFQYIPSSSAKTEIFLNSIGIMETQKLFIIID